MNRVRAGWELARAAALAAGIASVSWAAAAPRNPDVRVENWIHIGDAGVHLKQVHSFQRAASDDLWKKLDTDGDGRFSAEEKGAAAAVLMPLFNGRTVLKLNWTAVPPESVEAAFDVLPRRRSKRAARRAPLAVTFRARYPVSAAKADVVELLSDLDAREVTARFSWDAGYIPLRASMGQMGRDNTWDMTQVDGVPESFSLVVHRRPSGADSLPNP